MHKNIYIYIIFQNLSISIKYHTFIHNCKSIGVIYVKFISYLNTAIPKDFRSDNMQIKK